MVPHIDGGYRMFVNQLVPELERAGHVVEVVWLPFSSDPKTMLSEMLGFRMMNLDDIFDLVLLLFGLPSRAQVRRIPANIRLPIPAIARLQSQPSRRPR